MSKMNVLVVDGHPLVRQALSDLLETWPEADRVHQAESTDEAVRILTDHAVDLLVSELQLRGELDGADLCRRAKMLPRPPRVLIYSGTNSPWALSSTLSAGADSFAHKSIGSSELLDIIEQTRKGQRLWVLGDGADQPGPDTTAVVTTHPAMTRREQEVLSLVLRRYTNEEIAHQLSLAHQTVKNHVSSVLRKLGVASRRELFRSAAPTTACTLSPRRPDLPALGMTPVSATSSSLPRAAACE